MIGAGFREEDWWKSAVFYQIFPASYKDTNGDGFGDLQGVICKLEYLSWLGIDAIWLSPVFKSPLFDMGYDVTDYQSIHPAYGNLDDLKELIAEAHERKIRIILDLVLNHTSEEHPWFQESRSSENNVKRDWYIWEKGSAYRKPGPWKSLYGGSGWTYDRNSGEYYYHTFFKEQPDLNWRNRDVRTYFHDVMRYWLNMGVDGFRLDAINVIIKDEKYGNPEPSLLAQICGKVNRITRNQPEAYRIIEELRAVADEYSGTVLVGEIYTLPPGNPALVAGFLTGNRNPPRLNLAFDFSLIFKRWDAKKFHDTINAGLSSIPDNGWPCHVLSNHDLNRTISSGWFHTFQDEKAKVKATLLLTLKGTPFMYYGEEIGLRNVKIPKNKIKDPLGKRFWPLYQGRDGARTPMQWNNSINEGFSKVEPWLPVHRVQAGRNVLNQMNYNNSILLFYHKLLILRKSRISLKYGDWIPLISGEKNILAYFRSTFVEKILIILNFSNHYKQIPLNVDLQGEILLSTHRMVDMEINVHTLTLFPFESSVILLRNIN
jgi:alpha-glucosidase